ncbi:MAG TPA: hypothetical protein ENN76_03465 [Euryarchaeota archaeon]|nr:hypothetical protein [Euryarchaeota archaeon]
MMKAKMVTFMLLALCFSIPFNSYALDLYFDDSYTINPPPDTLKAGDAVNVFLTLRVSDGDLHSNLTTVLTIDGEERFFQNVTGGLAANSTKPLWYAVILPAGNFTASVLIDPYNEIDEANRENNIFKIELNVRPWNQTEENPPVSKQKVDDTPIEYLPYVMVALIVIVVALTGLAIYILESRRSRIEEMERELFKRR